MGLLACLRWPDGDLALQVWNYETWDCLVHKSVMDHVWSVSLHPSGTFMALGMTDKLRIYMILKDDILEVVALPIRKCDAVRFSNGGKFFAAVNSRTNNIHVSPPPIPSPLPPYTEVERSAATCRCMPPTRSCSP